MLSKSVKKYNKELLRKSWINKAVRRKSMNIVMGIIIKIILGIKLK